MSLTFKPQKVQLNLKIGIKSDALGNEIKLERGKEYRRGTLHY